MGCGPSAHAPAASGFFDEMRPDAWTPRERRLRLVVEAPSSIAGAGLKLADGEVNALHTHRAFHVCLGRAEEAIEVAFAADGGCVVVAGHHTLGFQLDNWFAKRTPGTRCHFSNWHVEGCHAWQLNEKDMTISPRGDPAVVLGWGPIPRWGARLHLVAAGDAQRLCFARGAPSAARPPFKLALDGRFRGRGLALHPTNVDATMSHKAMHATLVPAAQAIDVELDARSHLIVVGGHSTLGYGLDDWYMGRRPGTRCHFSNWTGAPYPHVWQLNTDMTFSPRGCPQLVLGWSDTPESGAHLHLCARDSALALTFLGPRAKGPVHPEHGTPAVAVGVPIHPGQPMPVVEGVPV